MIHVYPNGLKKNSILYRPVSICLFKSMINMIIMQELLIFL